MQYRPIAEQVFNKVTTGGDGLGKNVVWILKKATAPLLAAARGTTGHLQTSTLHQWKAHSIVNVLLFISTRCDVLALSVGRNGKAKSTRKDTDAGYETFFENIRLFEEAGCEDLPEWIKSEVKDAETLAINEGKWPSTCNSRLSSTKADRLVPCEEKEKT
ncbi:hypothetical protein ElyMa_005978600 [Elysia marginata]|uniref:Uncharacterized protein n=1 Tax=Elysia marginata TaxID=1093978 RepID=A0AAV4GEJ7_9GAST|nr:hypothetical protein ElyMa_005978600 [Elysia marginata]